MGEAMICGTPVIATAIGGAADHIQDGINGYLFPPRDMQALAARLAYILRNREILRAMRSPTADYARAHLTWRRVVDRVVEEVYMPLVRPAVLSRAL
jgi:glycosyltransferase involved in cell wall biosynthesis